MIFQPEHAGDISSVYLLNQIFESVSDLFVKEISKKDMTPTYVIVCVCVCVSSCSFDKKIAHCCFSTDKIKNKNTCIPVFGCTTGNTLMLNLCLLKVVCQLCIGVSFMIVKISLPEGWHRVVTVSHCRSLFLTLFGIVTAINNKGYD